MANGTTNLYELRMRVDVHYWLGIVRSLEKVQIFKAVDDEEAKMRADRYFEDWKKTFNHGIFVRFHCFYSPYYLYFVSRRIL